jgi:hypothetical protein
VKTIGDLLALVLDKETRGKLEGQAKAKSDWRKIVEKAYTGNQYGKTGNCNDGEGRWEIAENINAMKAADHSRMAYIKNNVLFVEADHQGWIQILQTIRKNIIGIINREYPGLSIRNIAFLLVNDTAPPLPACEKFEDRSEIKEYKQESGGGRAAYENIKDERLKAVLMRLEDRITAGKK